MLRFLGSSESVASGEACCDVCSGQIVPSARLDILVPTHMTRHRKPKAVRAISAAMGNAVKMALVQERKVFSNNAQDLRCLGVASFSLTKL